MKRLTFSTLAILICMTSATAQNEKTKMDSVSYSLGVLLAQNLKKQGFTSLDATAVAKGLEDVVEGNDLQVSEQEANQIVSQYMQAQQAEQYEGVIAEGKQFLAENAKREEVTVLPSGLQYEVIKMGDGPKPTINDQVTVHYEGRLLNGKVFDSSIKRGQPVTFGVTQVIQGWVEALQLMPAGSKWRLFVPYDLAYGERGAGQDIGPFETLVFEVELISVN
jgi:FKBP-type peptidyl-prolyl cis-trans isomerase FklB